MYLLLFLLTVNILTLSLRQYLKHIKITNLGSISNSSFTLLIYLAAKSPNNTYRKNDIIQLSKLPKMLKHYSDVMLRT